MQIWLARRDFTYLLPLILLLQTLMPQLARAASQVANGVVQLTITAQVYPSIPITSATCGIGLDTLDPTGGYFSNGETIQATTSGNNITCVITEPYNWVLTALTGTIGISYSISAQNGDVVVKSAYGSLASIPASTTGTTPLSVTTIF